MNTPLPFILLVEDDPAETRWVKQAIAEAVDRPFCVEHAFLRLAHTSAGRFRALILLVE